MVNFAKILTFPCGKVFDIPTQCNGLRRMEYNVIYASARMTPTATIICIGETSATF